MLKNALVIGNIDTSQPFIYAFQVNPIGKYEMTSIPYATLVSLAHERFATAKDLD